MGYLRDQLEQMFFYNSMNIWMHDLGGLRMILGILSLEIEDLYLGSMV